MGFKKSCKSYCRKCACQRDQRGRGIGSQLKKVKKLAKTAIKSDTAKMTISQGLAYAPKLYDIGTSRIKNKKVKQLVKIWDDKRALKQKNKQNLFKLIMNTAGFRVFNAELEKFLMNNGRHLLDNFVGVFPTDKRKEFLDEINRKETKCPS